MHPPKILSWLARQANLSMDRAEAIWQRSVIDWQLDRVHSESDSAPWQRLMDKVRLRIDRAGSAEPARPTP